jgi:cytochrome c-type biogenesis protein CcmH
MSPRVALFALGLCLAAPAAHAADSSPAGKPAVEKSAVESRLKTLAEELRCLVCQNQTLADSSADLAVDLRKQVESMIGQGKTNAEIKAYLVARYGDFVLYKPPVQGNTWLLWFGPFALLALGGLIWLLVQRRSSGGGKTTGAVTDSKKNIELARRLLDDET